MQKLLLCIFLVALASCETDELVPCSEDGTAGELCREYRYYNDSPIGFVEFETRGDSIDISRIYNRYSALEKTIITRFENGKVTVITEQFPNQSSKVESWHYNELDSLSAIVYGPNDSLVEVTYENGKRKRKSIYHSNVLQRYLEYRYYQDDGMLYRISLFNANDSLLAYWNHDYFSTGQNRISYFTSEHKLMGRRLYVFNLQEQITSEKLTNAEGDVVELNDYIYDSANLLIESSQTTNSGVLKSRFLYY